MVELVQIQVVLKSRLIFAKYVNTRIELLVTGSFKGHQFSFRILFAMF